MDARVWRMGSLMSRDYTRVGDESGLEEEISSSKRKDIERLTQELEQKKKDYFDMKRREKIQESSLRYRMLRFFKWFLPGFLFALCFFIQNMCLHVATHFYVQWMYRLRTNLGDDKAGTEKTITGERLSTSIDEGALHDVFATWLGYHDIPTKVIDLLAIMVGFVWFVLVTFVKQDGLRTWTKCCLCGAFLALGKGFIGVITVVPDSTGWSHCKDRLGDDGVKYFKDADNMNTRDMVDFAWDLVKLEALGLFKGDTMTFKHVRYCADMVYSGHTYAVSLFSLGLYDLVRQFTDPIGKSQPVKVFLFRLIAGLVLSCIVAADVVCILLNRFHYSMDVALALLITLLLYTNGAISIVVEVWYEWQEPRIYWDASKPNPNRPMEQKPEFMIPPCCIPFCCWDGTYSIQKGTDHNGFSHGIHGVGQE